MEKSVSEYEKLRQKNAEDNKAFVSLKFYFCCCVIYYYQNDNYYFLEGEMMTHDLKLNYNNDNAG